MDSKKSPKGRKRSSKGGAEEGAWDCSVCTFKNNAEAFKCSMCDVRKGTSTRKPRLNPDLVAAQQAQALTPPPPPFPGAPGSSFGTPLPSSSKSPPLDPDEDDEMPESPAEASALPSGSAASSPAVASTPSGSSTTATPSSSGPGVKGAKKTPATKKAANETKRTPNKARLKNVDRNSATYHSVTVDDFTVVITEFKPKVKKEKKAAANNNEDTKSATCKNGSGDQGPSTNKFVKKLEANSPVKKEPGESASNAPIKPSLLPGGAKHPENGQPKVEPNDTCTTTASSTTTTTTTTLSSTPVNSTSSS